MRSHILSGAFLAVALMAAGCTTVDTKAPRVALSSEPEVRVRIVHTLSEARMIPASPYVLAAGGRTQTIEADNEIIVSAAGGKVRVADGSGTLAESDSLTLSPETPGGALLIGDVPFGVGWWWESREDRVYEGRLEIRAKENGTLDVVLALPVEEYLRGVVPSEIGGTSPTEALKAQAVAARSETMTALAERTYAGPGYDICADVDCQVYSGAGKRTDSTDAAIRATRGVILSYNGKPIPAFYASNCGGHSEDIENVWPVRDRGIPCWSGNFDGAGKGPGNLDTEAGAEAWIKGRPEVFCNPDFHPNLPQWTHKNFRWEVETSADDLTKFVAKKKDVGRVTRIEPLERGPSGRMIKVRFHGEKGTYDIGPELAIRQIWAPPLKSSAFIVAPNGPAAAPTSFKITGAGYGHGVGMCQTGAIARAQAGQDYKTILEHYYRESVVGPVYE